MHIFLPVFQMPVRFLFDFQLTQVRLTVSDEGFCDGEEKNDRPASSLPVEHGGSQA
jgi:hypothetical protein